MSRRALWAEDKMPVLQLYSEFRIHGEFIRKILLVSVKFLSAILGPEMAEPILWTPAKNASALQEKPCP